jgi:diaminopimelate decarboxylase
MRDDEFIQWLGQHGEALRTPSYTYDLAELESSIGLLKGLLPANARVFYSLKANPQSVLVRHFAQCGIGAEAVSEGELNLCMRSGVPSKDIIAGGVAKSTNQLRQALSGEFAAVVIDSAAEWQRLMDLAPAGKNVDVLMRINPGVALGGLDMGGNSQFGMNPDEALQLAKTCSDRQDINFLGLHAYFGSQRLACKPIIETVRLVADVVEAFDAEGAKPGVVNIGLGCGVPYLEKDAALPYEELQEQLQEVWRQPVWNDVHIWSEAGRYLVAQSGCFVARVVDRKELHGTKFVFLDGGLNVHNPGVGLGRMFRSNPRFLFPGALVGRDVETVELVGNLCTSADRIGRQVAAPHLEAGELVVIPNSGAYCQTTAMWGFNSQPTFQEAIILPDGELKYVHPQHSRLAERPES